MDAVDLSAWDAWFRAEAPEIGFCPSDFAYEVADAAALSDGDALIARAKALFTPSLKTAAGKCLLFLGFAVLAALLKGMHPASGTAETANAAFRAVTGSAMLLSLLSELRAAYRTLVLADDAASVLLPVLLGFLTLGGMESTAGAVSASFALYTGTALRLIHTVVVPLCCIGAVLTTMDTEEAGRLLSLGRLLLRAAKWVLGFLASLFGLWNGIRGAAAASADGYLLKTVRFAAGTLPVVGGMAAESAEAAYQCLMLAKNAIGLTGVALLLLIGAKPMLSAFLTRCALRASRALSEPLAGRSYAEALRALSDAVQILLLCEVAAFALPILALAPMLGVGSFA